MAKTPEELLEERTKRIMDAIELKVPDRVPLYLLFSMFPATYAGMTFQEAYENLEKWQAANEKAHLDFEPDISLFMPFDVESEAMLDNRRFKWPGHGLGPHTPHQFVEGEYMKAEEYDAFLNDPSDFVMRTYLPRIYGALEGLGLLPPLRSFLWEMFSSSFIVFSNPQVAAALETISKVSRQSAQFMAASSTFIPRMKALGFPSLLGGFIFAPFDVISDFLRGLKGTTLDMFRCPDKLLAAQQKILPSLLDSAILTCRMSGGSFVFIPLHRGSDEFMSLRQFETFYWPGLKTEITALIDAGLVPMVIWEGIWDQRLEYLRELPKGKVIGMFDRTDLFKAKEVIGDTMCISGGMPASLLQTGTPEEVKAYAKKLIDIVGKDGGFIMSSNTMLDYAKPALVRVWVDFTKEYGVYQ
jgi:uroporphyrinogen-III decarboxylase